MYSEEAMIRQLLVTCITISIVTVSSGTAVPDDGATASAAAPFLGVWQTHFEQTAIILIIRPNDKAHFILIQSGSRQVSNVDWKAVPGGLIVDGLPRFRLWNGRDQNEVRAQMEALHPDFTNRQLRRFPLSFYMKRDDVRRNLPPQLQRRALPNGWMDEMPPARFDEQAGRPRQDVKG